MFLAIVPFLLAGADLVMLAVALARNWDRSVFGRVVLSIAVLFASLLALAWNVVFLWVVYLYAKVWLKDRFYLRLYRWGTAVEGRVVRKWEKSEKESAHCYLECEFQHPGLGVRKIKLGVKRGEYRKTHEGRAVSVLCYPHRRRPTRVYEFGHDFRCY